MSSFETIFITEGRAGNPAAEIQFGGQRLCVVSMAGPGQFAIEFPSNLYVLPQQVRMVFALQAFTSVLQQSCRDLEAWVGNVAHANGQT